MAFDPQPSTWFGAGYSLASHVVGFKNAEGTNPILDVSDFNSAADGDVRAVIFAYMEAFADAWDTIAADPTDLPTKMTIQRSSSINQAGTEISHNYSVTVVTAVLTQDITAE